MLTASLYAGHHRLIVPKIVVDETLGVYLRKLKECRDKEREAVTKFRRLSGDYARVSLTDGLLNRTWDAYGLALNQWLSEVNATVVPYAVVDSGMLSARAIERRKPFDARGRGLQDTLVWLTVLRLGGTKGPPIALVTGDERDFADNDGSLHADLVKEWTEASDIDAPELFQSLGGFVESAVRPRLEPVDELSIQSQLSAGYLWGRSVTEDIRRLIEEAKPVVDLKSMPVPPYANDLMVENLETISSVGASDIRKLTDLDMVATLDIVAEADLSFTLDKWDYEHFSSADWPMIDVVDIQGDVTICELFLPVRARLDIAIDASARRITAIQIHDIAPAGDYGQRER